MSIINQTVMVAKSGGAYLLVIEGTLVAKGKNGSNTLVTPPVLRVKSLSEVRRIVTHVLGDRWDGSLPPESVAPAVESTQLNLPLNV